MNDNVYNTTMSFCLEPKAAITMVPRVPLLICFLFQYFCSGGAWAVDKPNVILIMADDLGYGDLSCFGNKVFDTPCLDRMAAEGLRFSDFHSSGPVCSPTRAGLLTGRYQQRSGIPGVIYAAFDSNRHHGLDPAEITFPKLIKGAGYQTGMFGKWHLGYKKNSTRHCMGFRLFEVM